MKPLEHQLKAAEQAFNILLNNGYVYINGQPRSGKTLTAILVAEKVKGKCLVLTKKQAIPGWDKFIQTREPNKFKVINYEQLGKINGRSVEFKENPKWYSLVVIDESHNIGAYPKPSSRQKLIKIFCSELPHIHLSGTPVIESANAIYHQMNLGAYSPFKYPTFYDFFKVYGIPNNIWIRGQSIPQYNEFKPELLDKIKAFTVYMSQADAGITTEVKDKIHYINLNPTTKNLDNTLYKKRVLEYGNIHYIADSIMKLRTGLHQLEGGTLKVDSDYKMLDCSNEKIEYIYNNFENSEETGIMCHYVAEQTKIRKFLSHVQIFSSTAHAEGVDLSHLKNFIIYSSDYSGARFVQRRDRIVNINGSNTTTVHHLLVPKGISEEVYNCVSAKRDFNNETFKGGLL